MDFLKPPQHGGDLHAASLRYGIAPSDWLDLSTGINPRAYSCAAIDAEQWQRLPNDSHALSRGAQAYCDAPTTAVMAPGSQALIQWLPQVHRHLHKKIARVAVPSIGYSEHAFRWQWAGHEIIYYDPRTTDHIDELLRRELLDVLVVINPHNPLTTVVDVKKLLSWRELLAVRDGWLIVDEAFVDATPQYSIARYTHLAGLIVLRSFGKFFGLPGLRVGFALCADEIAAALRIAIGPWALSAPAQQIALHVYRDSEWQSLMRTELQNIAAANTSLLRQGFANEPALILTGTLFNSMLLPTHRGQAIANQLARAAILIRTIAIDEEMVLLRFGLIDPAQPEHWQRLQNIFAQIFNAE